MAILMYFKVFAMYMCFESDAEQCEDRVHGPRCVGVLRLSRRFARVDGEEVVDVARAGMKLD